MKALAKQQATGPTTRHDTIAWKKLDSSANHGSTCKGNTTLVTKLGWSVIKRGARLKNSAAQLNTNKPANKLKAQSSCCRLPHPATWLSRCAGTPRCKPPYTMAMGVGARLSPRPTPSRDNGPTLHGDPNCQIKLRCPKGSAKCFKKVEANANMFMGPGVQSADFSANRSSLPASAFESSPSRAKAPCDCST